jgi:hypothetical protein
VAGSAGFEPAVTGVTIRCITTLLQANGADLGIRTQYLELTKFVHIRMCFDGMVATRRVELRLGGYESPVLPMN